MGGYSHMGMGLVIGLVFGVGLGIVLGQAVAGGVIGVMIGLVVGYLTDRRRAGPPVDKTRPDPGDADRPG